MTIAGEVKLLGDAYPGCYANGLSMIRKRNYESLSDKIGKRYGNCVANYGNLAEEYSAKAWIVEIV